MTTVAIVVFVILVIAMAAMLLSLRRARKSLRRLADEKLGAVAERRRAAETEGEREQI